MDSTSGPAPDSPDDSAVESHAANQEQGLDEGHGGGQGSQQGHSPWQDGQASGQSPSTPRSALTGTPRGGGDGHISDGGGGNGSGQAHAEQQNEEAKRPRACEACRGLKVRCEMEDEGPCKRCRKAKRKCVVTVRTRTGERQRKTDTRVAELEKKIDALTASLQTRGASATGGTSGSTSTSHPSSSTTPSEPPRMPAVIPAGAKAILREWGAGAATEERTPSSAQGGPPLVMAGQKRKFSNRADPDRDEDRMLIRPPPPRPSLANYSDIVDRGVITMDMAAEFFARYTQDMCIHLPGVIFPPDHTVAELRKAKPILFLAVMAAASNQIPGLQRPLVKELMEIFADKIICTGDKSLELVQALIIAVIWYWPPEHFEELKFYQLVHTAAVMGIDIGLGRKSRARRRAMPMPPFMGGGFGGPGTLRGTSRSASREDPESILCRRTWLACYYLASNTGMALHRPHLVRWSQFLEESLVILQTSPDAAPTDPYLCHLVRTNKLGEEIGTQFSFDEPIMTLNLADAGSQVILRRFERELEKHRSEVPKDLMQPALIISFETLNIFMHEIALHGDTSDEVKPPFMTDTLRDGVVNPQTLTAAHINAISMCLDAIKEIFDTFLGMDIYTIRCIPVFNFVRIAYGVVVLIKIYFTAAAPDSEFGAVMPKDQMRVLYYLDNLLEKFRSTAANDASRPAAKFLVVLLMLRRWFISHSEDDAGSAGQRSTLGTSGGPGRRVLTPAGGDTASQAMQTLAPGLQAGEHAPTPPPPLPQAARQQAMADYTAAATANTPLQLLSEIATTDSGLGDRPSHLPWISRAQAPPIQQPFMYDDPAGADKLPAAGAGSAAQQATVDDGSMAAAGDGSWLGQTLAAGGFMPELLSLGGYEDAVDWEGLAMSFGMGLPAAYEQGVRSVMQQHQQQGDQLKPWFGDTSGMEAMPGQGAEGSMYPPPPQP